LRGDLVDAADEWKLVPNRLVHTRSWDDFGQA
jgi:hypothetical protein